MHHYAHLQSEEDCNEMAFVSASITPEGGLSGPVYKFTEMVGAAIFNPKNPVGEIALRHFSFIKIIRRIRDALTMKSKQIN